MKITFYGHSCFLVEEEGVSVLFDPYITPNDAAKGIDINTIRPNFILVSHGHGDHVADVESIARNSGATIVAAYEIASYYGGKNLSYHPMNIGGRWDFGKMAVKAVQAVHSSVLPDGTYAGNPMGFVVTIGSGSFYYSGDTALFTDMKLVADHNPQFAMLCIGDNFTMGIDDAVIAAGFVNCKRVIGMHYDTFPFIKIDHERAKNAFKKAGIELTLPSIGKSFDF